MKGLIDKRAIAQVLAGIITEPSLLDEYKLEKGDFAETFYTLIYSSVFNLYSLGANVIDHFSIDSYLSSYKKQYAIFNQNNGLEYISNILELYEPSNFTYFYYRLKKFSLLRYWESLGKDTKEIYNYTLVDEKAQEDEMLKFDAMTIDDMIDMMESVMINEAKLRFSSNLNHVGQLAGKGLQALKDSFKEEPDYGVPLQSPIISTIARGCRLGKLFLRSSNSGGGKTRLGIADMASISIPYFYDTREKKWVYSGFSEPTLVISTELEIGEVQTILIAYVSGVNETHILDGAYVNDEEERVDQAIKYISSSPFYIEHIPDFSIMEIEQIIRTYKREKMVNYFFFDYVHMSNKLITEAATSSRGMKLREDQILFLFIDALKNLCNKNKIFILSSTQLNGTYKDSAEKDETMLRGAKSMADRIDLGEISLEPSNAEKRILEKVIRRMVACPEPNLIRHIYKLRGNKWSKIKVVQHADLGTGRTIDLFVLNKSNVVIDVPIIDLQSVEKEKMKKVEAIITENSEDLKNMPEDIVTDIAVNAINISSSIEGEVEDTGDTGDTENGNDSRNNDNSNNNNNKPPFFDW